MSTGPVVPQELRDAIQAEMKELIAQGETQVSIGLKIDKDQVTVGKAVNRGKLGQEVADAFLRGYRIDPEHLIAKHQTRVTAGDVVRVLEKYPALAATIMADSARWPATRLLKVIGEVKRHPPNSAAGGVLIVGSWREMLDDEKAPDPKKIGGVERFRAQTRRTPKGG